MKVTSCRICDSSSLKPFFDLGKQPLANSLLKSVKDKDKFYPLALIWCSKCNLVQLDYTVDPKKLFTNYVWVTGTSPTSVRYAERFYQEVKKRISKKSEGYVLEVASNDGTFLKPFLKNGHKAVGIDPAQNIVDLALEDDIPTECWFFNKKSAKIFLEKYGPASVVFARNVLPHVANPQDFVEGLASVINNNGLVVIEFHYAKNVQEELHYDSIYHEHLCYFTLKTIEYLLNRYGLFIFDIHKSPISGGALVVYAKKDRSLKDNKNVTVKKFFDQERESKTNSIKSWQSFAKRSASHRKQLLQILNNKIQNGENIIGWGASARSSTLLNYCGIGPKIISSIIDLSPLKQNLFTAGTQIPIVNLEEGFKNNPQSVIILAWNFAKEIIKMLRDKGFKGSCLVPLPIKPKVYEI